MGAIPGHGTTAPPTGGGSPPRLPSPPVGGEEVHPPLRDVAAPEGGEMTDGTAAPVGREASFRSPTALG